MKVSLNKIVAVVTGRKANFQKDVTALYHALQRSDGLTGFTKTYRPATEEGVQLPAENKMVQANVRDILAGIAKSNIELLDAVATQDMGNTVAVADVFVDGETLLTGVPVPLLLYLEQRLKEVATVIDKIPTLSLDRTWTPNGDGTYSSDPSEAHRTQRVSEPILLAPATKEHPAQTQLIEKDTVVGFWRTVHQSGAMPVAEKDLLVNRARRLIEAVKSAREAANSTEVEQQRIGDSLMCFLFNG